MHCCTLLRSLASNAGSLTDGSGNLNPNSKMARHKQKVIVATIIKTNIYQVFRVCRA